MTKTAAAKRFASNYGVYSPEHKTYDLHPTLKSDELFWKGVANKEADARREAVADLRRVMVLLGIEDQYEDTVESQITYSINYGGSRTEDVVTKTGVEKFVADLRAAEAAAGAEEALKRLRKAIKNVKKEQTK